MSFPNPSPPPPAADPATAAGTADSAAAAAAAAADAADEAADQAVPGSEVGGGTRRRIVSWVVTTSACLLLLFALIAPNRINGYSPAAFVRIPLEGLIAVALCLIAPAKVRRVIAILLGAAFGVLAIMKIADLCFYTFLDRPFHPMWDWPLLKYGTEFLTTSMGGAGAIAIVLAISLLLAGLVVLTALSTSRIGRLVGERTTLATRTVLALGAVWAGCALLSVQIIPGVPVAAIATGRSVQVGVDLRDKKTFARQMAVDHFKDAPAGSLLTGLRGKDVLLAFVESYGRSAIENPRLASGVNTVLDTGHRDLRAAGFEARSAFLTSPTSGGGSWLAHSTLLSGVWVDNQQRYDTLVKTRRLTLNAAFRRAGWRTVAVSPGTTRAWPEASFFGYDQVYDRWHLGYRGPGFNWGTPPDQYTLSAFQRFERAKARRTPVMAELPMVSSHNPWTPTPSMIDWNKVGDGSGFADMWRSLPQPDAVWRDPAKIRDAYRGSIEYSLKALISYVQTYGDDDLVVVFLGDHQAAPIITGLGAGHDVPITIVARDRTVLDRIAGWGWQQGLKPGRGAPVWPMSAFRDRFLTAFGS